MAPKRKHVDAAYSARLPKKRTPPSAPLSAPQPPGSPSAPTRRSARTTRAVVNYKPLDTDDLDDEPVDVADSDNDDFTVSDNQQSKSSVVPSDLSMSSDHSSSYDQSDVGASDSGTQPPRKRAKTNKGRARPAAKSAPEPTTIGLAQVADSSTPRQKKSKARDNMLNLNKDMKKEVDLNLPPLFGTQSIFEDLVAKGLKKLPPPPEQPKKSGRSRKKPPPPKANKDTPRYSLRDVCEHVGSRPLRVATMCSGTESPLLAWDMISDCIRNTESDLELKFEHVFSAEIVPYKQAYIERNFRPPIIFRDITEITSSKDGKATSAYGAKVEIPGNVDMVIAGTACVDFSKLNSQQKTLEERGESGDTFAAVLDYAKTYRPAMLVLENVLNAPWNEMMSEYESIDYVPAGVLVDSKIYYLPQTRQRGYMVCIDRHKLDRCSIGPAVFKQDFHDRMTDFRRPVSAPLSSFILPNDDPLVTRASQSMVRQSVLDNSLRDVDWAKCEIRHINYRREKQLGISRPMTDWQESGTLVLPEYCNRTWYRQQVERVWDFMDMSLLRKANAKAANPELDNAKPDIAKSELILDTYDVQYKTRIWDVSQNIDRFTDSAPFGISTCLTPSGIFYITDRGGPLTFTESLMLQGLPLDRISFTTETERQIQDLAGNAMSTTVVGSAIASVLISGFQTLPKAPTRRSQDKETLFKSAITPHHELIPQPLPQATARRIDVFELQADACKSAAMCVCEGQIGLAEKAIQACSECGHTSCLTCGVKPLHEYGEPSEPERDEPENFIQKWRPRIPMVLKFSSSDDLISRIEESLRVSEHAHVPEPVEDAEPVQLAEPAKVLVPRAKPQKVSKQHKVSKQAKKPKPKKETKEQKLLKQQDLLKERKQAEQKLEAKQQRELMQQNQNKLRQRYLDAVRKVPRDAFAFKAFRRASSWIVVYESSFARLELVLSVHTPQWKLYAKPEEGLSGLDESRKFFEEPIATAQVKEDAFFGDKWQWRVPRQESSFELLVQGHGQRVPAWAARLGLPRHMNDRVWSELRIEKHGNSDLPKHIDGIYKHIQGTYKLLPDCGTARESLYKRIESATGPSMFLFMDPARIGSPSNDCFVFARDHSRLQYDQVREITARVDAAWRPESLEGDPLNLKLSLNGHWIDDDSCSLTATSMDSEIRSDTSAFANTDCSVTKALVSLNFTLPSSITHQRYQGQHRIKCEDKTFFADFGWAMEPLRQILGEQRAKVPLATHDCEGCSPLLPEVRWRILAKGNSREFSPYEDPETARKYEHAIKSRPEPFVIECNLKGNSVSLDIGLNTTTLCHRAAGKLKLLTGSVDSVSWKLNTSWVEEPSAKFPPFTLLNNSGNVRCSTPVAWADKEIELYDIQQRSLTWMKHQEEGVGPSFVVKESGEALLPHLGWRIESEASAEVHVKGGVLADHAGFGKTVTSLALIHSEFEVHHVQGVLEEMHNSSDDGARIDIAATLVICPSNLVGQWKLEVERLLGYRDKRLVVIGTLDQLKKIKIEDLERARIVILNKSVLTSDNTKYFERLAIYAAMPEYTGKSTRALELYLRDAASRVPEHLRIGRQQGWSNLKAHLDKLYKETLRDSKYREYAEESRRLKGRAYAKKKNGAELAQLSEVDDFGVPQDYKNIETWVLLEMFRFNRLVVDEFSYTEPRELVMYCNIKAHKRWALSATPKLKDTYDVSRMAKFLGINLPVGASGPGLLSTANLNALRKDMTGVEVFETLRQLPSRTTQKSVHTLSQLFLDTFLRRNVMKPDQFPYQDMMVPITLNADNRLVYTDLSQKLNSQDMRIRKGRKRVDELSVMPNVTSAEEALLCVAAVFDPLKRLSTGARQKGVKPGLEALVEQFETEHRTARESLANSINTCREKIPENIDLFDTWIEDVFETNSLRDRTVVKEIADMAEWEPSVPVAAVAAQETPDEDQESVSGKEESKEVKDAKDLISDVVNAAKVYASWTRTLRFVTNALKHERRHHESSDMLTCDGENCTASINDSSELHLSANCGHSMCADCVESSKNLLGICPANGCEKDVRSYHLLKLNKLGESVDSDFGSKADELTTLLKRIEAQDQQAIVFVQGADRITEMTKILDNAGIEYYNIRPSKGGKASLPSFDPFTKTKKGEKTTTVLILNSDDETAAGANLTIANHVIFFSPLLKRSQYEYDAQMAQAIGRVRRPGQKNDVCVYRFVSLDTVDVDILEHREHRTTVLAECQDEAMPGTDFPGKLKQKLTKAEKTQLIRDPKNKKFKLVPRQMLLDAGGHGVFEGTERILGYDKFNSLIKFSSGFIQDD